MNYFIALRIINSFTGLLPSTYHKDSKVPSTAAFITLSFLGDQDWLWRRGWGLLQTFAGNFNDLVNVSSHKLAHKYLAKMGATPSLPLAQPYLISGIVETPMTTTH